MVPIRSADQLPLPGSAYELHRLEAKASINSYRAGTGWKLLELCKDVVAMANGAGGTILVGVAAPGALITKITTISSEDADSLQAKVDETVPVHCRPRPLVECTKIPQGEGRCVLAINVWPSSSVPVGVSMKARSEPEEKADEAWLFPIRSGSGTPYLWPDQFGTLDDVSSRKIASMLIAVKVAERETFRLWGYGYASGANAYRSWFAHLLGVSLEENSIHFSVLNDEGSGPGKPLVIPLEWAHSVWRDPAANRWDVSLRCTLRDDGKKFIPIIEAESR